MERRTLLRGCIGCVSRQDEGSELWRGANSERGSQRGRGMKGREKHGGGEEDPLGNKSTTLNLLFRDT